MANYFTILKWCARLIATMDVPTKNQSSIPSSVKICLSSALFLSLPLAISVKAEVYQGIDFPQGASSFADRVVSLEYNEATNVSGEYRDSSRALGIPDGNHVSLGNASDEMNSSALIVEFVNNRLVDVPGPDLYIFEVGPAVEATNVAISTDGQQWYELGRIQGATRSVDLARFNDLPPGAQYRFVRLRDYPDWRTSGSPYGGPDIDAIGAIGSVAASPEPVRVPPGNRPDLFNPEPGDTLQLGNNAQACRNGNVTFQAIGNPQVSLRFEPAQGFVTVPYIGVINHQQRGEVARFEYSISVGYPRANLILQNSTTPTDPPSFPIYFFDGRLMPTYGDVKSEYAVISGFGSYDHYFNVERGSRTGGGEIGDVMWRQQCSG
ncbi:hypothetical protein SAMN06272755_0474 [Picosynechococcus sp. OG1]|nr:hypothetical protein SAMN06272755_0474 [Picosynechococcus sp. OG1]SMQ84424.1 hypothetical protein SAMN06272774_2850 [Synechococcus sp. 7002]